MQSYLLGFAPTSSPDGRPFSSRLTHSLISPFSPPRRPLRSPSASAIRREQDHYAVLGLPRHASAAEIKKAFRLLARKYHPDVSKDTQAGEVFKSIRLAYEVLSDESRRTDYDKACEFQNHTGRSYRRTWSYEPDLDLDDRSRIYRWAELRQQMRYQYYKKRARESTTNRKDTYGEVVDHERGPFAEVLWFAFSMLFFAQIIGSSLALTLCSLPAILDRRLDAGYKMGYVIAWIMGGRGGILLSFCISFVSWLCGKSSGGVAALYVLAMWVGVSLSRFAPIPQGAVLALLYMSVKFHVD